MSSKINLQTCEYARKSSIFQDNQLIYYEHFGYNSGMKALTKFEELGITDKIFRGAAILGLMVIGGMIASMVSVNLAVSIGSGDSAIAINDVLNGIMPKMLPLLTTLGIYKLIKKGISTNWILVGIIGVSILGKLIGLF